MLLCFIRLDDQRAVAALTPTQTDEDPENRQLVHCFLGPILPRIDLARMPAQRGGRAHFRKITSVSYHEMFLECVAPLSTTDFSSFGTATGTRQPGRFPTLLTTDDWY
jgi:hypothetical protein